LDNAVFTRTNFARTSAAFVTEV